MSSLDVPVSGRISADDQAEPGQVLGRLTDVGWGNRDTVYPLPQPEAALDRLTPDFSRGGL